MADFLKSCAILVLGSLAVALVLTGITVHHLKQECDTTGGTFTLTTTVASCHY